MCRGLRFWPQDFGKVRSSVLFGPMSMVLLMIPFPGYRDVTGNGWRTVFIYGRCLLLRPLLQLPLQMELCLHFDSAEQSKKASMSAPEPHVSYFKRLASWPIVSRISCRCASLSRLRPVSSTWHNDHRAKVASTKCGPG